MKVPIITIAGLSSRFNEGINEDKKVLKCIYTEKGKEDTLLYHLLKKCSYADYIILVGGYKYDDLCLFYKTELIKEFPNVRLVENKCYDELGSGYSLYLGIEAAMKYEPDDILFVEGDLDIDNPSFSAVIESNKSVLTYTAEPIYADRAVVLYQDNKGRYKYVFNSSHGLLSIDEPFSCILNSGQTWKFRNIYALKKANEDFFKNEKEGTNLEIIQRYVDAVNVRDIDLIQLKRWTNCNTKEDYKRIKNNWEVEE